jgi:uncharacterized protein YqeY
MAGMPTTYEKLRADVVTAMKARDAGTLMVLRTADAAIQRAAMDGGKPLDEALVVATLRKAVKNLTDAKAEFARGGRTDLVTANETEIRLLEKYLPAGLDAARLEALVAEAIQATGAQSKKDMGKVIGALKQRPEASLIDFGAVSKIVQAKLPPALPEAKKPELKGESGKESPESAIESPKPPAGS